MRNSILIIITILIAQIGAAQSIEGVIFDKETGEPLPFANVILFEDSIQISGMTTSMEGEYSFDDIAPGTYDVEAVYVGYPNQRISGIKVEEGIVKVDVEMEEDENGVDLSNVYVSPPHGRLFRSDGTPNFVTIHGKVFDEKTKEGLPFANIILLQKGVQIAGTTTTIKGNYIFGKLEPGEYNIEAVYIGYPNARITGILVENNAIPLDISMQEGEGKHFLDIQVIEVNIPIIRYDETSTGATWKAHEIKRFPRF